MSYQAIIHHTVTGQFLIQFSVEGNGLREAEKLAIAKAALKAKAHPRDMDVRHLHECCSRKIQTDILPNEAMQSQHSHTACTSRLHPSLSA